MKIILSLCAALLLSSCALLGVGGKSLRDEYASQQLAYNAIAEKVIALRAPCVEIGPTDPGCVLKDDIYFKVRAVQTTADAYLKSADLAIQAGTDSKAKFYLTSAAGAITAVASYIGQ
jgi:hypothetical protein